MYSVNFGWWGWGDFSPKATPPRKKSIVFLTQKYYVFDPKTLCFWVLKTIFCELKMLDFANVFIINVLPNLSRFAFFRPKDQLLTAEPFWRVKSS
jgi:hypothetical protein